MTAEHAADWWRDQAHRLMDENQKLTDEVRRLRAELDRTLAATGQVRHADPAECGAAGCGCVCLTAEEAVIYALREARAANVALAERLAACSEVLGRAAERGKVCRCQRQAAETEYTVAKG